jgi:hypothetical protein
MNPAWYFPIYVWEKANPTVNPYDQMCAFLDSDSSIDKAHMVKSRHLYPLLPPVDVKFLFDRKHALENNGNQWLPISSSDAMSQERLEAATAETNEFFQRMVNALSSLPASHLFPSRPAWRLPVDHEISLSGEQAYAWPNSSQSLSAEAAWPNSSQSLGNQPAEASQPFRTRPSWRLRDDYQISSPGFAWQ